MLDELDLKALRLLMEKGRATWAELAQMLGLSAPAAAERVRRLEERGIIRGYAAIADPDALGLMLTAFVAVTLERPEHRTPFLEYVDRTPHILECYHIAGEHDYLLKVRCATTRELDDLIGDGVKGLPGISRTQTTIVMRTRKETVALPLERVEEKGG
jgi:Lrp/AsnC family transcriptional regulator, leucine-responsive regulatory protein